MRSPSVIFARQSLEETIVNLLAGFNSLSTWCSKWNLTINPSKSKLCIYSQNKQLVISPSIKSIITSYNIPLCSTVKDLEINFNSKLTFKSHILELNSKLRCLYGMLYRNFSKTNNPKLNSIAFFIII